MRRELARKPVDVIACGDWQTPAERDYCLSRQMLEIVHDLGFPLFIVERSPLLTRPAPPPAQPLKSINELCESNA